jgi:hypothetical protein
MSNAKFSPAHLQAPASGGATALFPASTDPLCVTPTASERPPIPIFNDPAFPESTSYWVFVRRKSTEG